MFLGSSSLDNTVRLRLGVAKLTAIAVGFRFFFGGIIQPGYSLDSSLGLVKVCLSILTSIGLGLIYSRDINIAFLG